MTTEEAKAVYECLNHDQTVSPVHFTENLLKLHSSREAAYAKLDKMLEEKGPLNPYEFALLNPHGEFPTKDPEFEDFYDMGATERSTPNTQNMEDWSILSTEIHYANQKSSGSNNLLVMEGEGKLLEEWATSGKAPAITETNLPNSPLLEEYLDKFDSISNKLHDTKSFHDNRDVSTTYLGRGQTTRDDKFHPQLSFPFTANSHTHGKAVGGDKLNIL